MLQSIKVKRVARIAEVTDSVEIQHKSIYDYCCESVLNPSLHDKIGGQHGNNPAKDNGVTVHKT